DRRVACDEHTAFTSSDEVSVLDCRAPHRRGAYLTHLIDTLFRPPVDTAMANHLYGITPKQRNSPVSRRSRLVRNSTVLFRHSTRLVPLNRSSDTAQRAEHLKHIGAISIAADETSTSAAYINAGAVSSHHSFEKQMQLKCGQLSKKR